MRATWPPFATSADQNASEMLHLVRYCLASNTALAWDRLTLVSSLDIRRYRYGGLIAVSGPCVLQSCP
nr:putative integron gene cassette protein [uncultured bacterium]